MGPGLCGRGVFTSDVLGPAGATPCAATDTGWPVWEGATRAQRDASCETGVPVVAPSPLLLSSRLSSCCSRPPYLCLLKTLRRTQHHCRMWVWGFLVETAGTHSSKSTAWNSRSEGQACASCSASSVPDNSSQPLTPPAHTRDSLWGVTQRQTHSATAAPAHGVTSQSPC